MGEPSAQVAGGQRRARRGVRGKGRVKSGEGGQADMADRRVRGIGRAGGAGNPRGLIEAAGFAGSQVRRSPSDERWEPAWAICVSWRRARPRAQSGVRQKAAGETSNV